MWGVPIFPEVHRSRGAPTAEFDSRRRIALSDLIVPQVEESIRSTPSKEYTISTADPV